MASKSVPYGPPNRPKIDARSGSNSDIHSIAHFPSKNDAISFMLRVIHPSKMSVSCGRGAIFHRFDGFDIDDESERLCIDSGLHFGSVLAPKIVPKAIRNSM